MFYVIGSGPSGIAAAKAILKKGLRVTMIDMGLDLEPEIQERLKTQEIENVDVGQQSAGFPRAFAYGSKKLFEDREQFTVIQNSESKGKISFAAGGHSHEWLASLIPTIDQEIEDWPVGVQDLEDHYREVLSWVYYSASRDRFQEVFPIYSEETSEVDLSAQAQSFISDLNKSREILNRAGIQYGRARLALDNGYRLDRDCVYCGRCFEGCPRQLIYNCSMTLNELKKNPNFTYIPEHLVYRLEDAGDRVMILAKDTKSGENISFYADRVFLAAGILASTKIVLESIGAYSKKLMLFDSSNFLLPLQRESRTPNVSSENLITLPQIFMATRDAQLESHMVFSQVFTYSKAVQSYLQSRMRSSPATSWKSRMEKFLLMQVSLHSDVSNKVAFTLLRDSGGGPSRISLSPQARTETMQVLNSFLKKMGELKGALKAEVIESAIEQLLPGHTGQLAGSFPMREEPSTYESDRFGRPFGWERLHIVDTSVLSSVPATPLALTLMANAHRIAAESLQL